MLGVGISYLTYRGVRNIHWFRLYTEARNDAKLRMLSDSQHRVWFHLLCFAAEQTNRGTIKGYDNHLLAVEVANGDVDLLQSTLEILQKLRIINIEDDELQFINFSKRQYDKPSDHPSRVKERVAKHREKKRNANETLCNDTDTDTDTDTDINSTPLPPSSNFEDADSTPVEISPGGLPEGEGAQPEKAGKGADEYTPEFEDFWGLYPRRKEKRAAFRCWKARLKEGHQPRELVEAARLYAAECNRKGTQEEFTKQAKTFLGPNKPFLDYKEVDQNANDFKPYRGDDPDEFRPYRG